MSYKNRQYKYKVTAYNDNHKIIGRLTFNVNEVDGMTKVANMWNSKSYISQVKIEKVLDITDYVLDDWEVVYE